MSDENRGVLETLERLAATLKALPNQNNQDNHIKLSHWRSDVPEGVVTAFAMMEQGRNLVEATSTKFALVSKHDITEGSLLAKNLLRGCELLSTATLVVYDPMLGCHPSLGQSVRQAVRAVIHSCISLLRVFIVPSNTEEGLPESSAKDDNFDVEKKSNKTSTVSAAPQTGAVWESCEKITKLPQNNRNAMRRELFTWIMECEDTMREFQELLDSHNDDNDNYQPIATGASQKETSWEAFMSGASDEYSKLEHPIVAASLAIIKCSRGSLKVALQACEAVGSQITKQNSSVVPLEDETIANENARQEQCKSEACLLWISQLFDLARNVGNGMTELGSQLYPPLEMEELSEQVTLQCTAILKLLDAILEGAPILDQTDGKVASKIDHHQQQQQQHPSAALIIFDSALIQLSSTIRAAVHTRAQEAHVGIAAARLSKVTM